METLRALLELLGGRGATANAAAVLARHAAAMAEVDSVVDRLHRQGQAHQPAA